MKRRRKPKKKAKAQKLKRTRLTGTKDFNLWARVTTGTSYRRVAVPLRLTADRRRLLDSLFPGWLGSTARKVQLVVRGRHIRLSVPVAKPRSEPEGEPEAVLGCDVGMSALLNLSNGLKLGRSFRGIAGRLYDEYLRLQAVRSKFRDLKARAEGRAVAEAPRPGETGSFVL